MKVSFVSNIDIQGECEPRKCLSRARPHLSVSLYESEGFEVTDEPLVLPVRQGDHDSNGSLRTVTPNGTSPKRRDTNGNSDRSTRFGLAAKNGSCPSVGALRCGSNIHSKSMHLRTSSGMSPSTSSAGPTGRRRCERVECLDAGPFQIGSTARVKQPQMAEAVWRVLSMTPGQRFSWETGRRGLRMVGTHEIIPTATGCTSRLSLDVSGFLGRLLWPLIRRSAAQAVATENSGLRDRCQLLARSVQQNAQQAM